VARGEDALSAFEFGYPLPGEEQDEEDEGTDSRRRSAVGETREGSKQVRFVFLGKSKLGKVSNRRERGGEEDPTHLLRLGTCTGTIFGHRES
jgi:hypothetical protein